MKNILLPILILLSTACFGQAPITLDTVNNACHIDKIGFAKDNMTYTLNGDSSLNIFIVGAANYQNAHYSRFRDPAGAPFSNRTALTNWLDLYFFANALADTSGSGGGTVTSVSATTQLNSALSVSGSPITGSGSLDFTFTGSANQLVAGDGSLVNENTLALGETSTTAYRGDRGKTAYDHSQLTSGTNPHNTTFANIASKPTNVSGYGITDAIVQGGNTFGAGVTIGSVDNNAVSFIVNNAAVGAFLTTGNFRVNNNVWQNSTSSNNSTITMGTSGILATRNVADANNIFTVNNINASSTGLNIVSQNNGTNTFTVSKGGNVIANARLNIGTEALFGSNSIIPTHSVTIPSVGSGFAYYNTADQTTNYERLTITKAANVFNISTSAGGTGVVRDISINGTTLNSAGVTATKFILSALNTAPASATDTGTTGEIRITAGFIYVCTATNTWVRASLATW